jgi:hypothetical protein
MDLKVRGIEALKRKFATGYEQFKQHTINELNVMVADIAQEARTDAADLPYLPTRAKKPYERTGFLSRSINSMPYNGSFAEVIVNAKYGPYVEFGTGKGFGVPTRKYNITNKNILPYASIFRGTNLRNNNMPYRSYLFSNFEIEYSKALKRIRAFKIK